MSKHETPQSDETAQRAFEDSAAIEAGRHVAGLAADLIFTTVESANSEQATDAYIEAVNEVVAPAGLRLIRDSDPASRVIKVVSSPIVVLQAEAALKRFEAISGPITDADARAKKLKEYQLELTARKEGARRRRPI
jgi:hypothetical protein